MDQRISLVTLGVDDLDRARRFYEQLGWSGQEVEQTVFFQAGGIALVLWGRDSLRADSGIPDGTVGTFDGIVLAHNVRSEAEVDTVVASAKHAGARVTHAPQRPSTAATPATSPTPTATPGKSPTTLAFRSQRMDR